MNKKSKIIGFIAVAALVIFVGKQMYRDHKYKSHDVKDLSELEPAGGQPPVK